MPPAGGVPSRRRPAPSNTENDGVPLPSATSTVRRPVLTRRPVEGATDECTAGTAGHSSRPTYDASATTDGPKKRTLTAPGVQAWTVTLLPSAGTSMTGHESAMHGSLMCRLLRWIRTNPVGIGRAGRRSRPGRQRQRSAKEGIVGAGWLSVDAMRAARGAVDEPAAHRDRGRTR